MLDKLQKIEARLAQVEQQLADPSVYSDRQAMAKLSREQKELTPVVEAFRAYARAEADIAAATEMLSDPELRELGQEELSAAKAERERLEGELKRLLLPKDPNDEKNVVLEIRAGIGGEEGALFAADLHHVRRAEGLHVGCGIHQRNGAGRRKGSRGHRGGCRSFLPSEV